MYEGSCATDGPWDSGLELTRTRPVFSAALPAVSSKGDYGTGSWVLALVLPSGLEGRNQQLWLHCALEKAALLASSNCFC